MFYAQFGRMLTASAPKTARFSSFSINAQHPFLIPELLAVVSKQNAFTISFTDQVSSILRVDVITARPAESSISGIPIILVLIVIKKKNTHK
jgi:hypothetical protein